MSKFCRLLVLSVVACLACDGNDDAPGMATGGGGSNAGASAGEESRSALADMVKQTANCKKDSECAVYNAPCLQQESGNCAGIFYTNVSSVDAIDARRSEYEACLGHACGAGGGCALGPHIPTCVDGVCR